LKSKLDSLRRVWHRWIDAIASHNYFCQPATEPRMKREFQILLGGWLLLAAFIFSLGWQNLSSPGLNYDEAIYGGLTKDFVTGHASGGHMPGVWTTEIFGAPFPIFVQPYLGALKCWLLIPIFKVFGSTLTVLRTSNLFFCAVALFILMLWTWRLLGLGAALLAGLLLAFDPAFFFLGVLDWGSLLPSLLCRFAGFFLVLLAWRRQSALWALIAGLALGLGFFNKIDFGVLLAGTALAAACVYAKPAIAFFRNRPKIFLSAMLGFLIGAGPILALLRVIFQAVFSKNAPAHPGELAEKVHTHLAMYDGSYFYRLMDVGGLFDKMYQAPSPVWTPFGIVVLLAVFILIADVVFSAKENPARRTNIFLLLAGGFVTLGILILPGAVRIHHTTLVYPFPHLLIAAAVVALCNHPWKVFFLKRITCGLVTATLILLVFFQVSAIARTQRLIRETGGRGWWSNALVKFAEETKGKPNLIVSSLDWGFNEQLEFLADDLRLEEPIWKIAHGLQVELPRDTNHLYLVHPPGFSEFGLDVQFMDSVSRENKNAVVQPWRDGQGRIVFYAISFPAP
jgi:Dolichyl-phosphate-mannose-protein mannosyltransferase